MEHSQLQLVGEGFGSVEDMAQQSRQKGLQSDLVDNRSRKQ